MTSWASKIFAITLFVEDLAAASRFYREVFEAEHVFSDDDSAAYRFGPTIVNLLRVSAAPTLIEPAPVGPAGTPARAMYTVPVDDVDAVSARLIERGVPLLNGPQDRPWGPRTACFQDPAGHVWEISS